MSYFKRLIKVLISLNLGLKLLLSEKSLLVLLGPHNLSTSILSFWDFFFGGEWERGKNYYYGL